MFVTVLVPNYFVILNFRINSLPYTKFSSILSVYNVLQLSLSRPATISEKESRFKLAIDHLGRDNLG